MPKSKKTKRQKRKKTISEKLSKAESVLDTGKFDDDDYVELYHRYIPKRESTSWLLDPLKYSSTNLKTDEQLEQLIYQRGYAKQTILAIALSQLDKQRLKETEQRLKETKDSLAISQMEYRHLEEGIPPGLSDSERVIFLRKRVDETCELMDAGLSDVDAKCAPRWVEWNMLNFNWYQDHQLKEIEQAIQVDVKTIRAAVDKPKGRKKSGKSTWAKNFLYCPDECLFIMKWWLRTYLPAKSKGSVLSLAAGTIIRMSCYKYDLSDAEQQKIINAVEEVCDYKTMSLFQRID